MWEVFKDLSHYCASVPRFSFHLLNWKGIKKQYGMITLETRTYPVFNQLYELFISEGIKVIKPELFNYLTPKALAYLIMCDGTSNQYGLIICTDCFTVKEVVCLINILKIRYDLNCSINTNKGKPRLYIKAESMNKLKLIIEPHILNFSNYKLEKGKRNINKVFFQNRL